MKLEGTKEFKGQIHFEYVPFQRERNYWPFEFQNGNISLKQYKNEAIAINNFEQRSLERIKNRVRKFYPNDSEKGIQGHYVTINNNHSKRSSGFFIDTEFEYGDKRIDLIWVDLEKKKIAFVELKTIDDARLYTIDDEQLNGEKGRSRDTIGKQLKKYYDFAKTNDNKKELLQYYSKIFSIKKSLEILPKFIMEKSLEEFELIEKPILLVGDCTQKWIDKNAVTLNKKLRDIAFGCVYQGRNTFEFRIPYKTTQYYYRLDTD